MTPSTKPPRKLTGERLLKWQARQQKKQEAYHASRVAHWEGNISPFHENPKPGKPK